jgi:hypothetical protein
MEMVDINTFVSSGAGLSGIILFMYTRSMLSDIKDVMLKLNNLVTRMEVSEKTHSIHIETLKLQLDDLEKRVRELEKHHKERK